MRAHVPRSKNIALSNGKNPIVLRFVVYGLIKTFGIAYVFVLKCSAVVFNNYEVFNVHSSLLSNEETTSHTPVKENDGRG